MAFPPSNSSRCLPRVSGSTTSQLSYVLGIMRGDIVSEVFPDDFPDEAPSYERHPRI